MLRIIILIALVYLTLRWLTRRKRSDGPSFQFRSPPNFSRSAPPSPGPSPRPIDEMKPCAVCGTYIPARLAWRKNELYFCGERCQEAFSRQKA
jgi:hypothetical protein